FYTLPPCRAVDTRLPAGPFGGPILKAGQDRVFSLAGRCGIPPTARAVSGNVTAVGPTAAGGVRLYPPGQTLPAGGTVDFAAKQTRANNTILLLNADRQVAVRDDQPAGGTTHFLLDVN